jgi:predicted lipid-binding transport protein (Tim44 family)
MRFLFLPYDLVNYAAGLLKINYGAFLLATLLGSLPGTLAFTLAGASIEGDFTGGVPSLNPRVLIASVVIFVASLVFSRVLKNRQRPETLVDGTQANSNQANSNQANQNQANQNPANQNPANQNQAKHASHE